MELVSYEGGVNQQADEKLPPINNQIQPSGIGGRYTIAASSFVHNLPPRSALRNDNHSGVIDSWPAHSNNQRPSNIQMSLTKNNTLVISNALAEGKPELTPKPKFLENLEKFLHRELKKLGATNNAISNEARLQAYREAFEYLLEEFKTYKPILTSIKNEYELMLASQREKIRELEPLKQMLVTLADQCDHKLMQYREEEKIEIVRLKEEKKKLMDLVAQLRNDQVSLQTQVDKLHQELLSEHEKFRAEQDKRKLLILDVNDLRFQQEEAKMAELKRERKKHAAGEGKQEEEGAQDDPITLKIALKVCRQNLTDAMKRLTRMEADYNDVVPRRDHEKLDTKFKNLGAAHENLQQELSQTKSEYNNLKEYSKHTEDRFKELQQEMDDMREVNTPRPDWDHVEKLIDAEKWKDLSVNKSSTEMLDVLIHDMSVSNKREFLGMGTGPEVPIYLRLDGRAKNRNLPRRDISNIVAEIIKERVQQKENPANEGLTLDEMPEFFIGYLKRKYFNEAYDYSYSLNDGFQKYSHENIQYFYKLLTGDADENISVYETKMVNQFNDQLKAIDSKFVSKKQLTDILKTYFKSKELDQIEMLARIAEDDSGSTEPSKLEYQLIFDEESEEKQFMSMFKTFVKEERVYLASKIKEAIGNASPITSTDLRKAVNLCEESINEKNVDKIVNFVFSSQLDKQLENDVFKKRIDSCCLYNYPTKK